MNPAQPALIATLLRALPEAILIETHISWVILTGGFAYKLKKPVNLGFLDFSTLDKRHICCQEEVRLNGRLAPDTYLETLPITGSLDHPTLGGSGPVLEWAVKMRAFPPDATLDREAIITPGQIDAIADRIARFHRQIEAAPADSHHGTPEQVQAPVRQNFLQLRELRPPQALLAALAGQEDWARAEGLRLVPHFEARKQHGFIRECHGDLHLGNIAWVVDAPLIFDGIEFNPDLRFIDVISEIAFLVMDLNHRGEEALAWRVLNRYLEQSGDYEGLAALPYYMGYRAMVRAKVAAIRAHQAGGDYDESLNYIHLAQRLGSASHPALILMHGVSGSGKTVISQHLLEGLGAIRLRADVERKRLHGLAPLDSSEAIPGGIYTREAGERTRNHLLFLAHRLLEEGFRVIVDATFLARDWREPFQAMATENKIPWCLVSPQVPNDILRQRVAQRRAHGKDASEADLSILDAQLANQTPLTLEEWPHTVAPETGWDRDTLLRNIRPLLNPKLTLSSSP
jgi:aminoglycoside phosphotransferase family enzyme/predicted kinase